MKYPIDILKETFGYTAFRRGQKEIIDKILSGQDVLGVMPTGAGKSLCYQVPALALEGLSIVVSPLISLIKDQVDALQQNGVRAKGLSSVNSWAEVRKIIEDIHKGRISLLYVSPERFENDSFKNFFQMLDIELFIIDEAHCVSHWGHDFRPSYLKLGNAIASLAKRPIVAAFTATATPHVREDIVNKLALKDPYTLITGFNRENLFFEVEHPRDKFQFLVEYLKKFEDMSGIIYCSTRRNVEDVCSRLCLNGINAVRYHAGLTEEERTRNQELFIYDRVPIIVATSAFGMGIDKSNVRYVVHYNMPANIDSYYQETGRAGRDGASADCMLLYSSRDPSTCRFLIEQSENEESKKASYKKLQDMIDYCHTERCLRATMLNYFGEDAPEANCRRCGSCVSVAEHIDVTLEAKKILSCVFRMEEKAKGRQFGKTLLIDVLRGSENAQIKALGLKDISTWGLMKPASKEQIGNIIAFLIAEGYLAVSNDEYPILFFTDKTRPFLKSEQKLMMRRYQVKSRLHEGRKKTPIVSNEDLFERLRLLRRQLADAQNVPPYIIFSDTVLYEMCASLPESEDEFLNLPGVGHIKLQKYGEAFIDAIREWKKG